MMQSNQSALQQELRDIFSSFVDAHHGLLDDIVAAARLVKLDSGTFVFHSGVTVISLVFVGPQSARGWAGLVPLITGIVGTCPVCSLLGIKHS